VVAVDGRPLPVRERTRLFLYHKPRGLVTAHADPAGRPTIFDALPKSLPRLISVGRLDINTEGLLLLTNDGGLARMVELPVTGWLRRYRVRAHGRIAQDALDRLRQGITIDGIRYGPIEARVDRAQESNVWLTFAIREGKNREVKNVLGHLGLAVNRLIRVSFGPFQLGELPQGAVEEVKTRTLREQLGPRLTAAAGADFSAPVVDREPPAESPPRGHAAARRSEAPRIPATAGRRSGGERKRRALDADRLGEPERARREKRRRRRPARGKRR
jgi:23S rRNA pseudouridine2605 synthase